MSVAPKTLIAIVLSVIFGAASAEAATCFPARLASLGPVPAADGGFTVTGMLNGEPHQFAVVFSGPSSYVSGALAGRMGMKADPEPVNRGPHANRHQLSGHDVICYSGGALRLAGDQLRKMHLYFAFKQEMFFLAAADGL